MAIAIIMPQVGQDIETAKINEWHVKTGDRVETGDIIATVESDKASFEVEAHTSGYIHLLYEAGDEAAVFKPIAYIGEKDEQIGNTAENDKKGSSNYELTGSDKIKEAEILHHKTSPIPLGKLYISPSAKRTAREFNISLESLKSISSAYRIKKKDVIAFSLNGSRLGKASPLARNVSREAGVNPSDIKGSGYNKRVMVRDVLAHIGMPKSKILEPTDNDRVIVFSKARQRIAQRLSFSKHTIPHYYLFSDVDVSNAQLQRENFLMKSGLKISINDIVIKATAEALATFPELNAWVDDQKMILKSKINIGMAVATDEGLLVPVLPSADNLSLPEINEISRKNASDARRGIIQIKNPGTFTVTNLGMYGISRFLPIINPPECAILSLGAIEEKIIAKNGKPAVASMLTLGLACDHRAVDGSRAAMFLAKIKELLEK